MSRKRSSEEAQAPPFCEACKDGEECKWVAFHSKFVNTTRWTEVVAAEKEVDEEDRNRKLRKML